MNTKIQASSLLAAALLVVGTVGFASCDDDNGGGGTLPSASDMYGNYVGTVRTVEVTHNEKTESSEGGTSEGAEVSVKVDRDTIYFDAFPVKDIIISLYGEEEAPAIIEMPVSYTHLEPFTLALLGNSAADLGYGGSRRAEVHRVGRRAESRDRPFGRGRLHVRESAEGFRRGRFQQGKLR